MRLLGAVYISILVGILFIRLSGDYSDRLNWLATQGACMTVSTGACFLSFVPVAVTFPQERTVVLKQQRSKLYSTFSYFMSRNIVDLPHVVLTPLILTMATYWIAGFQYNASQFFIFLLTMIGGSFSGSAIGLFVGSIATDSKTVSIASSLVMQPSIILSGFGKNLINFPSWMGWVQYLTPIKYGFAALVQNEVQFGNAPFLAGLNLNTNIWMSIGLSFVLGIGLRIASFYVLWKLSNKGQ